MELDKSVQKQRGSIVFGGGLNARAWIDRALAEGYVVFIHQNYAELWK